MSEREKVTVTVGGEALVVRSELPPEYTREVAAYLDETLRSIRTMMPALEAHKAAILAGLSVTDELFRARRTDAEQERRLSRLNDDLSRLLPPTKRNRRTGTAE